MKKFYVITGLVLLGVIFLAVQFYILKEVSTVVFRGQNDWSRNGGGQQDTDIALDNIRRFLHICHTHHLSVFLMDQTVLSHIAEKKPTNSSHICRLLCLDKKVITFGVRSDSWNDHAIIMKKFQDNRFSYLKFHEPDKRVIDLSRSYNISVPTHYIFERQGHIIHVVIIYQRRAKFLWHGAMNIDLTARRWLQQAGIGYQGRHLKMGAHAGAYDSIETVSVTMDGLKLLAPRYPANFLSQLPHSRYIECSYVRAKQFYKEYPETDRDSNLAFRQKAKKLLKIGKKLLDSLGIPFWLSSGTCLGWFRQCDIIPYSKDVDFGIFIKDYKTDLIPTFEANNLALKHVFGKVSDSYELSFTYEDLKLDIFFFYEEEKYMWNGGTQASTGKKFKYYFPKFSMCFTEFLDLRVRVPCETEAYIEANYGKDWYRPVESWDWKNSPPNVRENGEWSESEMDETVQLFETGMAKN